MTLDELRRWLASAPPGSLVPVEAVRPLLEGEAAGGARGSWDLSVQEVAELLGRAPSTIRGWIGEGLLPGAYRLRGREWRIPRRELERLREEEAQPRKGESADLGSWRRVLPGSEGGG